MTKKDNGDWNAEKEDLKKRLALLTEQDMLHDDSQNDEMWAKLHVMLGKTNEESNLPEPDL